MKRVIIVSLVFAILATACGVSTETTPVSADAVGNSDPTVNPLLESPTTTTIVATTPSEDSDFPVSFIDSLGEVTIGTKPMAIVSLSPASTEILFAVGAGDQVLAVDSLSNFPESAPLDPDLSAWTPNIEAIIGMNPDLVVISGDTGDFVAGLNAAGIPVITHFAPANLDDVYSQIEQVGAATGNTPGAAALIEQMQADIAGILAGVPTYDVAPTYYHELDDTLYSVTSQTFIGQMYALLGLRNVADPADADGSAYGYPQLSAEYLVDADPDLIFLADTICCGVTAESVAGRAGWETMSAVQNGWIVELNDDVASRWGPRVVELLRAAADALTLAVSSD